MASRGDSGSRTSGIFEAKMNPLEPKTAIIQIPCRKADFVGFADVNLGLFAFPGSQQGMEPKEANSVLASIPQIKALLNNIKYPAKVKP